MAKTSCFWCREHGFDPWSGNQNPTFHVICQKKKKKKAWGKRQELPSPLQRSHPPRNFICSPIWKLSEPHAFGFLIATSLLRQSWLNHWPLMIELSLQPLTFLEVGGRAESSNSLIRYLVFLTSRHLNVIFWIVNFFFIISLFSYCSGQPTIFLFIVNHRFRVCVKISVQFNKHVLSTLKACQAQFKVPGSRDDGHRLCLLQPHTEKIYTIKKQWLETIWFNSITYKLSK